MDNFVYHPGLMTFLKSHFKLDIMGLHGLPHWARVYKNAQELVEMEQARGHAPRLDVIHLFSYLHDHERQNDDEDYQHGGAAAENALKMRNEGRIFKIDDEGFALLCYAMTRHSHGDTLADITVQICWDADRLDLGRCNIIPDPKYLCTESAKETIMLEKAYARSVKGKKENV